MLLSAEATARFIRLFIVAARAEVDEQLRDSGRS